MKTAKLFRNGRSQAVRLPKEFRFRGTQVFVKKTGNTVLLIPVQDSWQTLFDSLSQFSEDFGESGSARAATARGAVRMKCPLDTNMSTYLIRKKPP